MRKFITLATFLFSSIISTAQLCPGGGLLFSSAVLFDPAWTVGCTSGTSCTGGTTFDNREACEPTTAIDPCAPSPSGCGTVSNMASDLWFKFYAANTTVTININPSVSLISSIQAFSGGVCTTLTQIGCVTATGVGGITTLNLTGLTVNNLYYYRVFGTGNNVSQRTGTFCFCGSAQMSNVILPLKLLSFNATVSGNFIKLKWITADQVNFSHFDIERSTNGTNFNLIGNKSANYSGASQNEYSFRDYTPSVGINFYRLKMIDLDGRFEYSPIVRANTTQVLKFSASIDNQNHRLIISIDRDSEVDVYTLLGVKITTIKVKKGNNSLYCDWINGIYLVRRNDTGVTQKVTVLK